MEIYFLRHGRSRADDEKRHEGRYDSPLTEVGREQVLNRAWEWKEQGLVFDGIIASPLIRAHETAKIVGDILGACVETDENWMEMDNGALAGLTYEEGLEKFPIPEFVNPYVRIAGGTGESPWLLHGRAINGINKIIERRYGRYLVVSHGGILNAAMRIILGIQPPINRSGVYFKLGDTAFIETEYILDKHIWVIKKFEGGIFVE